MRFTYLNTTKKFIHRTKERAAEDDTSFTTAARDEVKGMLCGYVIYYAVVLLSVLGLLSILSFTDLLGGPFLAAQILLFLFAGTVVITLGSLWWLWLKIRHKLNEMQNHDSREDFREATVVDGKLNDEK